MMSVLLAVFFALQKLFTFMKSHVLIIDLSSCDNVVLLKNISPVPMSSTLFYTFFSSKFSVSCFMLKSLADL